MTVDMSRTGRKVTEGVADCKGENQARRRHVDILASTSIALFDRCSVGAFRQNLQASLKAAVQLSQLSQGSFDDSDGVIRPGRSRHIFDVSPRPSPSSLKRYNSETLKKYLWSMMDNFPDLFQHHDHTVSRRSELANDPACLQRFSALEELVRALLDPTIIPGACAMQVLSLFFKAFVEDTSISQCQTGSTQYKESPHAIVLQRAICVIVRRSSLLSLADQTMPYFRSTMKFDVSRATDGTTSALEALTASYNVARTRRCLLLLDFIVENNPHGRLEESAVSLIIDTVVEIDSADVLLTKMRGSASRKARKVSTAMDNPLCSRCQTKEPDNRLGNMIETRKRGPKVRSISDLHDRGEEGDKQVASGILIHTEHNEIGPQVHKVSLSRKLQNYGETRRISMKKVMGVLPQRASRATPCACLCYTIGQREAMVNETPAEANSKCTLLSIKMVMLRGHLYRGLLSIVRRHANTVSLPREGSGDFTFAVQRMVRYPLCAATRLCAVLIADAKGIEEGFLPLLRRLLDEGNRGNGMALHSYAELAVELSFCDDARRFWQVTEPLLVHALESSRSREYSPALRAISYIFIYRRRTLAAVSRNYLRTYLVQLSVHFGEERFWVDSEMDAEERNEVVRTLQSLSILSFICDEQEGDVAQSREDASEPSRPRVFPFPPSSSLRDAVARMGPRVGCSRFLSRLDSRRIPPSPANAAGWRGEATGPCVRMAGAGGASKEEGEPLPPMPYLDGDVVREIFAFLGYRRLARSAGVCRMWRFVASEPEAWRARYRARFRTREEEGRNGEAGTTTTASAAAGADGRDWWGLFARKWEAERRLRSSYSRCGTFRHRTCDFVGCLAVLRSRRQCERHAERHCGDAARALSRAAAEEERDRRREAMRCRRGTERPEEGPRRRKKGGRTRNGLATDASKGTPAEK